VDLQAERVDEHFGATGQAQGTELDHLGKRRKKPLLYGLVFPPTAPIMSFPLRALCLAACLALPAGAIAQEENSAELRDRAQAIRDAADARYTHTTYHCYDKFLVNACLDAARLELIERIREARLLEARANRIDRGKRIEAMEARLRKIENRPAPATAESAPAAD
jgi:hypothetical protein